MVFLPLTIQALFLTSIVSCFSNSITTELVASSLVSSVQRTGGIRHPIATIPVLTKHRFQLDPIYARRRDDYYDSDEDESIDDYRSNDYVDDDDDDDDIINNNRPRRTRGDRRRMVDDLGNYRDRTGLDVPSSYGRRDGWRLPTSVSKSLLAGVFVLGIGLGVTVDSQVNTNPKDLASRDAIDNAAPNPNLCASLGASAMAFDQRVFVSFNPFNVYVSQADVKPACVLREANVVPVLKARGLINDDEVRSCKQNMNTWAFVGSLDDTPQLSCVYKSQDAQNEFLSNPKVGIGEDYLDDDRLMKTGKIVKGTLTEGQKDMVRDQLVVK